MLGRIVALSVVAAVVLLVILLNVTKPATIGPLGILFVIVLMYVSVLGALTFLLYGGSRLWVKARNRAGAKKPLRPFTFSRAYYYSSVIALAPVMLIGMQSVGQVSIYEVFLVVAFVVIACIYIAKRT